MLTSTVARLMYAAGDVAEPGLESINYVEDLVVEFISDLVSYYVHSIMKISNS